jgi:hypothetical protein
MSELFENFLSEEEALVTYESNSEEELPCSYNLLPSLGVEEIFFMKAKEKNCSFRKKEFGSNKLECQAITSLKSDCQSLAQKLYLVIFFKLFMTIIIMI